MPTLVLHIGNPDSEGGEPTICLENFDPAMGLPTEVPGTSGEMPPRLRQRREALLAQLEGDGGRPETRAEIGAELFNYIADTSAGQRWLERCRNGEANDQPELRTYLHIEPDCLQGLPWELMTDAATGNSFAPFRSKNHFCARWKPAVRVGLGSEFDDGLSLPRAEEPNLVLPLSILVAIYDMPLRGLSKEQRSRAVPQIEVDAIFVALQNQPGIWQIEVLRNPSQQQLAESLKNIRPHILHFIGEPSAVRMPSSEESELAFVAKLPGRKTQPLTISALERIIWRMEERDRPRLFILNGCRTTAMASPEKFGNLGSKAVIANQAKVYGPPAVTFAEVFYRKLAEVGDVAKAVWEARVALWEIQGEDLYDWGIPVLTLYDESDTVIQSLDNVRREAEALIGTGNFAHPYWHFDRLRQSRQVWNCIDAEQGRKRIVLICGLPDVGKSVLLRSCMLTWKLRGNPAVLFDAKKAAQHDRNNLQLEVVLWHIYEALHAEIGGVPGMEEELAKLRAALQNASFNGDGDTDDADPYAAPCAILISILKKATKGDTKSKPLMLALDNISYLFPQKEALRYPLQKRLNQYIFEPIVRGDAGATYLLIAASVSQREKDEVRELLGWREPVLNNWAERVQVGMFESGEAEPLGHEYGARRGFFDKAHIIVHNRNGNQLMADWIERIETTAGFSGSWFPFQLCELADDFSRERAKG